MAGNYFDQFDAPPVPQPATPAPAPNYFDQFDESPTEVSPLTVTAAKSVQPPAPKAKPNVLLDTLGGFVSGIPRGLAETAMLPITAKRAMEHGEDWVVDHGTDLVRAGLGLDPVSAAARQQRDQQRQAMDTRGLSGVVNGAQDAARQGMNKVLYQPKTLPGRVAETIGEFFTPGGIPSESARMAPTFARKAAEYAADVTRGAVVPAVGSEALGEGLQGTPYEAAGRVAGALAGNVAAGVGKTVVAPEMVLRRAAGPVDDIDWAKAVGLQNNATGVRLTGPEAITQAQGGASALPNLQRVVEGSVEGRAATAPFFAARPGQVDTAVGRVLDQIAPQSDTPSTLGPRVASAAQGAIAASPEGQALVDAIAGAGPRTTALQAGEVIQPDMRRVVAEGQEGAIQAYGDADQALRSAITGAGPRVTAAQAGEVIQPELRGALDRREGMRNALADADYTSARTAAPAIPVDSLQPASTVTDPGYTRIAPQGPRPGEPDRTSSMVPQDVQPQTETPAMTSRTGGAAVQVDARPVVQFIDELAPNARAGTAEALRTVRGMLFSKGGVDTGINGLDSARGQIGDMITQAKQTGQMQTADLLGQVQRKLDDALSSVPEYARARQTFQAASESLEPFQSPGMAKAVSRDEFNRQFGLPAEQVADAVLSPSEARNFNQVASPKAKAAMENRLTTQLMDRASDASGNVNGDRLAILLRDNEDLLSQFPAVANRLNGVVSASGAAERATTALSEPVASPGITKAAAADTRPEQAADPLLNPSEARHFNASASPDARGALENRLATQILDKATDAGGNVSADALASALRDDEDLLSQFPAVADRLNGVMSAAQGVDATRAGPVGQVAAANDTATAGAAVLPQNPMVGSDKELGDATRRLAAQDPDSTSALVRQILGDRYAKAATETQEGSREFAGAKFNKDVAGNAPRRAALDAVVGNLPNGAGTVSSLGDLLDVLQATGRRKAIGSATEFNRALNADLGGSSPAGRAIDMAKTLGASFVTNAGDAVKRAAMHRSLNNLAEMFTDPQSVDLIRAALLRGAPSVVPEVAARTAGQVAPLMTGSRDGR